MDFRKVQPDFDAAEMGTFGADGRGDSGAEMAGWADIATQLGMHFAELGNLVHGRIVDFLLRIEAGAHGPFVKEME